MCQISALYVNIFTSKLLIENEKMTVKTVDDLKFWPKRKQNDPSYRYQRAESRYMHFNVVLKIRFHVVTKKDEL